MFFVLDSTLELVGSNPVLLWLFESELCGGMSFGGGRIGIACVYSGFLLVPSALLGAVGGGCGFFTEGSLPWLPWHQGFGRLGSVGVGFVVTFRWQ